MTDPIEDRPLRATGTMNPYQKLSTLLARLIGSVMMLGGLLGPVSLLGYGLAGKDFPSYPVERWFGSFFWAVVGLMLLLLGRPIGRALGRGLE